MLAEHSVGNFPYKKHNLQSFCVSPVFVIFPHPPPLSKITMHHLPKIYSLFSELDYILTTLV